VYCFFFLLIFLSSLALLRFLCLLARPCMGGSGKDKGFRILLVVGGYRGGDTEQRLGHGWLLAELC